MLILHRSERADQLVAALAGIVSEPLADPVTAEVVAVPTRGVERWITQRLSHRLGSARAGRGGVCANLDFPFPATLVARATAAATGVQRERDPWSPERAVWPLVETIDAGWDDPLLRPLVKHLSAATPAARDGSAEPPRRFAFARHLADLFDRYAVHRPEMVRSWAAGGGEGWQAHLWCLLRERIGVPSPAERLPAAVARLRHGEAPVDLPVRVSVFGLTRMPASHLEILAAVGERRDVHLFLLHPSAALWDGVERSFAVGKALPPRRADPTRRLPAHPLLRSWGRDAREMQLVLASHGISGGHHLPVPVPTPVRERSLLALVQEGVRADVAPGSDRPVIGEDDDSLQVHACHGRMRQVEVLRDAVLHLLQRDPTLEARDVIVMCPDIETFAPLVQAVFGGSGEASPGLADAGGGLPHLRVRLADRSLRQTNPLLAVAGLLLELAGSRVTASAVLDLASRPPVARRFGFDREGLSTIERWTAETGVHWGFDAGHRERWGLGRVGDNTWAAGLDRLTLGVAMADAGCRMFAGTVPYGDLPSSSVELTGRVEEMLSRLRLAVDRLQGPQPLPMWVEALTVATESLALAGPDEVWQHEQLHRILSETVDEAGGTGGGPLLGLEEVRSLLAGRLAGQPTRANFRTGDLTFCTLVPMRSVPHRVVALLGLDDGEFPRHPEPDGDDLLLADPWVGDREARSEDRQLLLDALLAATDHLLVIYSGRDERTNRPRPPCAPVAELLDVVDATVTTSSTTPARQQIVVHHPLQSFDRRNFEDGRLGRSGPWSFDAVQLAGARSSRCRRPPRPWLERPLAEQRDPVVRLEDLVQFVQHPVKAFLRQRLSVYLTDHDRDLSDALLLELDALQKWGIGDRMLEACLSGATVERAAAVERERGSLPPRSIASPALAEVSAQVQELLTAMTAEGFGPAPAASCEVRVPLPDGRLLAGSVPNVRDATVSQFVYSALGSKHRLAAWVRYLALTADRAGEPVRAVSVGRGGRGKPVSVVRLPAAPGLPGDRRAWAVGLLEGLVRLYDQGMCEPLPLVCRTSAVWAEGRRDRLDQPAMIDRARYQWEGAIAGESADPEHVYVWGRLPFLSFLESVPTGAGRGPGWPVEETSRFGGLARLLWDPILEWEERPNR